jgi:hypothetical protein
VGVALLLLFYNAVATEKRYFDEEERYVNEEDASMKKMLQ